MNLRLSSSLQAEFELTLEALLERTLAVSESASASALTHLLPHHHERLLLALLGVRRRRERVLALVVLPGLLLLLQASDLSKITIYF